MNHNWQQEKEMSNIFWLTLIFNLSLKLPRFIIRLLLHPIVFFFLITSTNKRIFSRHYLNQVLPYPPKIWHIYKHFYWFSSVLIDRIYFLSNKADLFKVSFKNREQTIISFKENPGQFFLGAHYGSVESLRTQVEGKKYKIKPVIKLDHNQTVVRLLNELNNDFYKNVIQYDGIKTTFEIYENLKEGTSVALLADRVIGEGEIIKVNFLNDTINLPKGIFEMVLKFPFPVNLFFSKYQGKNNYRIEYIPFIIEKGDTPQTLAQKFANILAEQCIESPYNWFNFYKYWEHLEND